MNQEEYFSAYRPSKSASLCIYIRESALRAIGIKFYKRSRRTISGNLKMEPVNLQTLNMHK